MAFVQNASASSQFVHQWKLRVMVRDAMLREAAASKPQRLRARDKTFQIPGAEWATPRFPVSKLPGDVPLNGVARQYSWILTKLGLR